MNKVLTLLILLLVLSIALADTITCEIKPGIPLPSRIVRIYQNGELYSQGYSVGPTRNGEPFCQREENYFLNKTSPPAPNNFLDLLEYNYRSLIRWL